MRERASRALPSGQPLRDLLELTKATRRFGKLGIAFSHRYHRVLIALGQILNEGANIIKRHAAGGRNVRLVHGVFPKGLNANLNAEPQILYLATVVQQPPLS